MRVQLRALPIAIALSLGCVGEAPVAEPPPVDRARFEAEVYPVLLRDCGFPACHGNPSRFFRVVGPGRARLDPATGLYAAPTSDELDASFDRARSMLVGAPSIDQALLLRKPLDASEGGGSHMGVDSLGRNVYASRADPGWRAIAAWAGAMVPEVDAGPRDASATDGGGVDAAGDDAGADASDDAGVDAP